MQKDDTSILTDAQAATAILELTNFLHLLLPADGMKCCVSINKDKKVAQVFAPTHAELAQKIIAIDAAGNDAYFACASFHDAASRKAKNALGAKAFWLDIDCGENKAATKQGYINAEEAVKQLDKFANAHDLPLPYVVCSGTGIHAYWILDSIALAADWIPVARALKAATERFGLLADPSRTADIASILRPIGTHNRKYGGAQPVFLESDDTEIITLNQFAQCIGGPTSAAVPTIDIGANILGGLKTPIPQAVAEGGRNTACARFVGAALARGLTPEQALCEARAWNKMNKPPLGDDEVCAVVASIARAETEKLKSPLPPDISPIKEYALSGLTAEQRAEVLRSAKLPAAEYDRQRKSIADSLGVRVATLDKMVESTREEQDSSAKSGRALVLPTPEPWPVAVDGAELLSALVITLTRYIILSQGAPEAIALWVLHTYTFAAFHITPRLTITSPEKRSGKTRVLEVLNVLVQKPLLASNISAAAMFRTIEAARPTLLIDEADAFMKEKEELRGVVNAGFARNGQVIRTMGDDHEPRTYSTWCPAAFAAIGKLADTIEDRSIIIPMRRRTKNETVERFRAHKADDLHVLARKAARWGIDNMVALQNAEPVAPEELNDRAADCWFPLLAIADVIGGEWPARARQAALTLNGNGVQEDQSLKVQLLSDIRDILAAGNVERIPSAELCSLLHRVEDRPWSDYSYGKPLSPQHLAKLLKPFGIKPKDMRTHTPDKRTVKGYEAAQFFDAFTRYL